MALVSTTRVNKEQVENEEPKKGKEGKKQRKWKKEGKEMAAASCSTVHLYCKV